MHQKKNEARQPDGFRLIFRLRILLDDKRLTVEERPGRNREGAGRDQDWAFITTKPSRCRAERIVERATSQQAWQCQG